MPIAAALLWLALSAAPKAAVKPAPANAAADVIVERALELGIDFAPPEPGTTRAVPEDARAYSGFAVGSWLDAQIQTPDDAIAEPPRGLRDYLDSRREPLWAIVAALEKGAPEWDAADEKDIPRLMPWIRLHKALLAAALCEELDGNAIEAERALEASWSLGRTFAGQSTLIARILCVAVDRWQAGVLRKFRQAPLAWLSRLSVDEPWRKIAEAIVGEARLGERLDTSAAADPSRKMRAKAMAAMSEALLRISPCDRDALMAEALFRPAAEVYRLESSEEARGWEAVDRDIVLPNLASMVRRTARLSVDQELTLRILELRLERAAARDGKWPEKAEITSTICPGATYRYRVDGDRMDLRFEGSVDAPESGVVLPLAYRTLDRPAGPAP